MRRLVEFIINKIKYFKFEIQIKMKKTKFDLLFEEIMQEARTKREKMFLEKPVAIAKAWKQNLLLALNGKFENLIDINVYFNDFRNSRLYDRAKVNSWLCFALIFSLPVPESFSQCKGIIRIEIAPNQRKCLCRNRDTFFICYLGLQSRTQKSYLAVSQQ